MENLVRLFGGPICDGITCAPLVVIVVLYRYGWYILGAVLLVAAAVTFVRMRGKRPRVVAGLLLLAGVLALGAIPIQSKLFNARHSDLAKSITFPVFTYETTGTTRLRIVSTLYKPENLTGSQGSGKDINDVTRAHIVERYTTDEIAVEVMQFATGKYPYSSAECRPEDPEFPDDEPSGKVCKQIGMTNLNTPIYASAIRTGLYNYALHTTVGETRLVALSPYDSPSASQALMAVMTTLRQTDAASLEYISK